MNKVNLFYIGNSFYSKSRTYMSPIYEVGTYNRYDWGFVDRDLRKGSSVLIRPATLQEMDWAKRVLTEILKRDKDLQF
jgi:hypothetical protein